MGTILLLVIMGSDSPPSVMMLSYLVVLGSGAQSVTADRDTRRSKNSSDKYKGVGQ